MTATALRSASTLVVLPTNREEECPSWRSQLRNMGTVKITSARAVIVMIANGTKWIAEASAQNTDCTA